MGKNDNSGESSISFDLALSVCFIIFIDYTVHISRLIKMCITQLKEQVFSPCVCVCVCL